MCEEVFGPVMTVYVYPEKQWEETLTLVDRTSPYALTGAVFAQDRAPWPRPPGRCAMRPAISISTTSPPAPWSASSRSGAPGPAAPTTRPARFSNLLRWVSPRSIKETFHPPKDYRYPFMEAE